MSHGEVFTIYVLCVLLNLYVQLWLFSKYPWEMNRSEAFKYSLACLSGPWQLVWTVAAASIGR